MAAIIVAESLPQTFLVKPQCGFGLFPKLDRRAASGRHSIRLFMVERADHSLA